MVDFRYSLCYVHDWEQLACPSLPSCMPGRMADIYNRTYMWWSTSLNLQDYMLTLLQVHVHLERRLMSELPEGEEAVAQWCKDVFVAKVSIFLISSDRIG